MLGEDGDEDGGEEDLDDNAGEGLDEDQVREIVNKGPHGQKQVKAKRADRYPPHIAEALYAYAFIYDDVYWESKGTRITYSYQITCEYMKTFPLLFFNL